MNLKRLQLKHAYTVDLARIGGKGDFLCPGCGVKISPDDETENTYSILELKVKRSVLEEVLMCCNRCGSNINLVGFSLEQEFSHRDQERALANPSGYVTHI